MNFKSLIQKSSIFAAGFLSLQSMGTVFAEQNSKRSLQPGESVIVVMPDRDGHFIENSFSCEGSKVLTMFHFCVERDTSTLFKAIIFTDKSRQDYAVQSNLGSAECSSRAQKFNNLNP
ncbi:MAG: hypothetical protein J0L93_03875 [Deltaproteobacteria bacterium]|nr:hypothetical protein [Deltaproteobacteria bacterium]